ncbi:MAG: polymer-forming cytoskeletal protein [Candidatus Krumholzibacteria bacterium]|nr:polymer-forming cytoskeletal protein [Candidatus Krumholzibacteria bacterium]
MLAFCNGTVLKLFLVVAGLLSSDTQSPDLSRHCSLAPAIVVCTPAAPDTAGTAKAGKTGKATKITISDEGIKIESEGSEKVILTGDDAKRAEIDRRVLQNLDSLKNLPESLATMFTDDEDKRFYRVKGSDVVQFGRRIEVGPHELVNGDVVSICSDISIEGKVTGDVAAICGKVELGPEAIVNGEVVSILGSVDREDGSVVRGETAVIGRHGHPGLNLPLGPLGTGVFGAGAKVVVFIITVLLMLIVLYFISQRMTNAGNCAAGSFLKSFGTGLLILFVGSVLVVVLSIILAITIVGIPVALLLVLSFIALCAIGYFVSALALGAFVCRKFNLDSESVYIHGIVGLFLLSIIGIIASFMFIAPWLRPMRVSFLVLAGLVKFVALATGIGAFIVSKGGSLAARAKPPLPDQAEGPGRLSL